MKHYLLPAALAAAALTAVPAAAQDDHSEHAGHGTPAPSPAPTPAPTPADPHAGHRMPAPSPTPADPHAGHRMPAPSSPAQTDPHAGHGQAGSVQVIEMSGEPGRFAGCRSFGATLSDGSQVDGARCLPADGSGTSRLPTDDGGMHGAHLMAGDWMVMAHGYAWGVYTDQSGPRGDDQAFVQSMGMISATRNFGNRTTVQLRSMFSLEPLMGARGYPNLFATGETAGGQSLIDRQHPHDLFMELAGRVDFLTAPGASIFVYGGPVAEPALGPSAFMHRRSARYLPLAPITHHWFDSTHITYGVVTIGYATPRFQIEASAFRGREPDEQRWDIETPALDSWSVRGTWSPSNRWIVQVSHGRLKSPETLHPGQDEGRTTASIQYGADNGDGGVSALLAFSAKNRIPGPTLTAWLAEGNWHIAGGHNLFGRVELVENDELFPDHAHPLHDRTFRVAKFEGGYAYRLPLTDNVNLALGGSVMTYARPAALDPYYGKPLGFTGFAKLSLGD